MTRSGSQYPPNKTEQNSSSRHKIFESVQLVLRLCRLLWVNTQILYSAHTHLTYWAGACAHTAVNQHFGSSATAATGAGIVWAWYFTQQASRHKGYNSQSHTGTGSMLLHHGSRCLGSIRCRTSLPQLACTTVSKHCRGSFSYSSKAAAVDGLDKSSDSGRTSAAVDSTAATDTETAASSSSSWEEPEFPEMQLTLPAPTNSQIKSAEFVKSSVEVAQCPPPKYPEFAVIGRSNVGKSSLINLLTNRKSLAMVSKQPGKTRCINHFLINGSWYLVDLPGYGYARTGKDARKEFDQFTKQYFKQRTTLAMVLLLVDCSIPPQDVDLEYAGWLGQQGLPFSIVFTKADKRKKGQQKHTANIAAFKQALLEQQGFSLVPPCLVTSASNGMGKPEVLKFVASLRVMFEQQQKQLRKRAKQPAAERDDDE